MALRTGGELVVAALLAQGTRLAFGVPGESFLAVLDALHDAGDRLRFIVCRQEGGAAYMAEAYGKLTGRPGVAIVTRGPGATNAAVGVHTAKQDSTPLLLLVGQVGTDFSEREAFQEIDYRRMYGHVAKWVGQIDRVERVPEYVAHAFAMAMNGRPGPVVLALPEDMLTATADVPDPPRVEAVPSAPTAQQLQRLGALMSEAQAPLLLVGGGRWSSAACDGLAQFAERTGLPVACAFRRQDLFDNRHEQYAGDVGISINPKLDQRVRNADLLLVVGERLGETVTSGYSLLEPPRPHQRLVHVHPGSDELGRVYQATLAICADPESFFTAMNAMDLAAQPHWRASARTAHADYEAWRAPRPVPGAIDMWSIVRWLDERLPDNAVVTNGAGNFATWMHRLYRYRGFGTQLAPYSGSMGYGVPAAVAAKALDPSRVVVSWNGDGCYLMNGQELATAVQHDLRIVFVVVDNGMYGTIRMHQERSYPDRVSGTLLRNPDFAALARAYGAHGETVRTTEQFAPAFERALNSDRPSVLHVLLDPQALTMSATLDELRAQGRANK
ncbi:MAG TPA: thiamine pyrophosphate-binding protein [Casimicrobiaceae bacterium]|nr:thiamine pyrophosphate-binding protein [Casimicrobiaceae bacterium]